MSNANTLGLNCCHCTSPFIDDPRLCCDQNGVCCNYDQSKRDCFWPIFTHPRWLCCRVLYCCRRRGR